MPEPITATTIAVSIGCSLAVAGIIALAKTSPKVMRWVTCKVSRTRFVVLGPAGVGKTSFYCFLESDRLAESVPPKTNREAKRGAFRYDNGSGAKWDVSQAFDIPGEWKPSKQAEYARLKDPKALLIFTSAQNPDDVFLNQLCSELAGIIKVDRKFGKTLRCWIIVINKVDNVSAENLIRIEESTREAIQKHAGPVLAEKAANIHIVRCSLTNRKQTSDLVLAIYGALNTKNNFLP